MDLQLALPAAAPALWLDGVSRRFAGRGGIVMALDRISLRVPQGGFFGLLGPNGAGKTTLLRLACGLLRPTAGRIEVLGDDPVRRPEAVRRALGAVLGGERALYWRLTGRENLLYAAALYDLPPAPAAARAAELLRFVDLTERADDLVEGYSTGMRQRLALARALVHDPTLLILDEPTAGLDPHAQAAMRGLLDALAREGGRTIVMATHNLLEADRLCDAVAIVDRGRLVANGPPRDLKAAVARPGGPEPTLEDVFLALTGRSLAAADRSGAPA
ncbi:MAG: ABC transporter ATP-binding protein [Armatimonadota bacterium]|nr:ABC transporter ATP-binding protein [Armatimonadota bacterium]MDR7457494.1 ABC transporter ATP-binding protein [Armatimonadota bacterium]MDR7497493.1 ABC transporter ATP-binding protein [Armatimonadota bacterium]MDR7512025.1 ABC transporter ATP-binding protein [Armatimonadota bacterium]